MKVPLTHIGYKLGTKSIETINENAEKISRAASIIGIMVISGLIAAYISLQLAVCIPLNDGIMLNFQTELIDKIFPNLLAVGYVAILHLFLRKKNTNSAVLIVVTFIIVLACSFFGIL